MGDNSNHDRATDASFMNLKKPKSLMTLETRKRIVEKMIDTLRQQIPNPELLGRVKEIAQQVEEKVFTIASDQADYSNRITFKMKSLMTRANELADSSMGTSAGGAPDNIQSASRNFQSEGLRGGQLAARSEGISQPQPHQIIRSPTQSIRGTYSVSSTSMIASSGVFQASGSSNLPNISRMPSNLEQKAAEQQILSSSLLNSSEEDVVLTESKDPISQSQQQKQQAKIQNPCSRQTIVHNVNSMAGQSEPPQKSLAVEVKHKAAGEQTSTHNKNETMLIQEKTLDAPREQRQDIRQPSTAHTVEHQRMSDQNMHLVSELPQQSRAQSAAPKTVEHHGVPTMLRSDSSGLSQGPKGSLSSQGRQSRAQMISQPKQQAVGVGKDTTSAIRPASQNLPRQETIQLNSEASNSAERQEDTPVWKQRIYQRILAMKNKYLPFVENLDYCLNEKWKTLDMQPNRPNRESTLQKIKAGKLMAERTRRLLNTSEKDIVPELEGRLGIWEQEIERRFCRPGNTGSKPLAQSLPRQTNGSEVQRPQDIRKTERPSEQMMKPPQLEQQKQRLVPQQLPASPQARAQPGPGESGGAKEKHLVDQRGKMKDPFTSPSTQTNQPGRNSHLACDPQRMNPNTSSVPPCRDIAGSCQPQGQPPTSRPSSSLQTDSINITKNCGTIDAQNVSDQRDSSHISPLQRLLNAVSSSSQEALKSAADDLLAVTHLENVMEATALGITPRAKAVLNLAATTSRRLPTMQENLPDKGNGGIRSKRTFTTRPTLLEMGLNDVKESSTESTDTNQVKKPKIDQSEPIRHLLHDINIVNQRLIDMKLELRKDDMTERTNNPGGNVVECHFLGVSVDLDFIMSVLPSGNSPIIRPLCLFFSAEYPNCSPVVLGQLASDSTDVQDLTNKARARLDVALRNLKQPLSLSQVAKTWEICAREVIIEYTEMFGGGTFSSKFGAWENF